MNDLPVTLYELADNAHEKVLRLCRAQIKTEDVLHGQ